MDSTIINAKTATGAAGSRRTPDPGSLLTVAAATAAGLSMVNL
ncbi:hypothetical protein [Streptomyces sp. NPDC056244]